jgi:hypothetical protein
MTSIAPRAWDTYSACAAVEGFDEQDHDQDEIISAWQHLIDTGHAFAASRLVRSHDSRPYPRRALQSLSVMNAPRR